MVKKTQRSFVADVMREHPDFDPMAISKELEKQGHNISPALASQFVLDIQKKGEKLGVDLKNPRKLIFEKVQKEGEKPTEKEIPPQKQNEIHKEALKIPTPPMKGRMAENEKPKPKIGPPSKDEIKTLEKAKGMDKGDLTAAIMSGKAKPIIDAVIHLENFVIERVLSKEDRLDQETQEALSNTWTPFLDQWLSKIAEENQALYVAIITTLILQAPILLKIAEKYLLKPIKKKEPDYAVKTKN